MSRDLFLSLLARFFSVRTSGLNVAPVGELLAWDFVIGKDRWSAGPMGYVGKAGGQTLRRSVVWVF